jgi:hypothetical protein
MYINYQASLLEDRLTVLAGYREEKKWERFQPQVNNFPWYTYFPDMHLDPVAYPGERLGPLGQLPEDHPSTRRATPGWPAPRSPSTRT